MYSNKFIKSLTSCKPTTLLPVIVKPIKPLSDVCCGNDCKNCVWTEYFIDIEKYEADKKAKKEKNLR